MKNKKIYLSEVTPRVHTAIKLLIESPPKGYELILPLEDKKTSFAKILATSNFIRFMYRIFLKPFITTPNLYESLFMAKIPEDANLIFSSRPLNSSKPYVVEILDNPICMTGYNFDIFKRTIPSMEEKFLSKNCKKIIAVNESGFEMLKKYFSKKVLSKTILIRAAVKPQKFKKNYNKRDIDILFLGSVTNPEDFYIKGGLESIESFNKAFSKNKNLNLIIRCAVPKEIKEKYKNYPNINFIEGELSYSDLVKLMQNTDILISPSHIYMLMSTLESMSYGIPIIALDTWAVKDYLNESYARIIKKSENISGYNQEDYPTNIRTKEFIEEIKSLDPKVINDLASAILELAENSSLRKKLGTKAKKIAETKFSLIKRQKLLKKVFDEATQ